jgi:hypothetical protein
MNSEISDSQSRNPGAQQVHRFLISYPRSGHHMLERIIRHVFSLHDFTYSYCEYYNCCQSTPCRYNKLLQKNHDGRLTFPQGLGRYLALYREDTILQIDAEFRYNNTKKHGEYSHLVKSHEAWWQSEQYINKLVNLLKSHRTKHKNFIKRWIDNDDPSIMSLEYYDFLEYPKTNTRKVLEHLFPGLQFGDAQIDRALDVEQPRIINQMPGAVYAKVQKRLAALNLPQ